MSTKIEWTNETWNPVTGCSPVTRGCDNCYAKAIALRWQAKHRKTGKPEKYRSGFKVIWHKKELDRPLHWRKPRMVFVCSMGDLFHGHVPGSFRSRVFDVIEKCPQHTFQVLTKRPENVLPIMGRRLLSLPNLWLGTSVCEQADMGMIHKLQRIPAALRFISYEPALGPIKWTKKLLDGIGWVICGCESGPQRRPFDLQWAYAAHQACTASGTPFFYKQGRDSNDKVVKMPCLYGRIRDQIPEVRR